VKLFAERIARVEGERLGDPLFLFKENRDSGWSFLFKEGKAMKRVFKSFLMIAMATAMVGLAVTQASADRIKPVGACLGVPCSAETVTVSVGSLSFGAGSFAGDLGTADSQGLEFVSEVIAGSDLGFPSAAVRTAAKVSVPQLGVPIKGSRTTSNAVALLTNSTLWSFIGTPFAFSGTRSAASSAMAFGNSSGGSFSVVATNVATASSLPAASVKKGTTFSPNGTHDPDPKIVGLSTVPEPTTMLLFGTGLVGAAAILRRRRRGRRPDSK
jgi:hypothetical protein